MKALLVNARQAGIKLHLEGEELRIVAPTGTLTEDLRKQIREHKAELVKLLRDSEPSAASVGHLPPLAHDLAQRHAPFPLSDVQHAYWMGRKNLAELGNVSTHFYFELDCHALDIDRLAHALRRLIDRHDMLRAVMTEDGMQRILSTVPAFQITCHDVRDTEPAEAERCLLHVRERLSHEVRPADGWPLFDVQATLLAGQGVRLHLSLDMLILDGWSIFMMFSEWFQLYHDPKLTLSPLQLSYRDYVIAERKLLDSPAYQRARDYWMQRIDALPAAPELPIAVGLSSQLNAASRFSRRRELLDRARWQRLRDKARQHGLTLSALLLSVYAEVLARWSSSAHFTLNLTLFNRLPLHPQVMQLLGDFTSLVMVEVDHRQPGSSFAQRAQQLQRQLMDDLEHREFSGVEVLREWSHRRQTGLQAAMPVVFTSALVQAGDDKADAGLVERFGPMVYGVSQTPQVWLDNQVMEVSGDLVFNWDAVDGVFEPGVLDAMFSAHLQLLGRLADDDALWSSSMVVELPEAMQARRLAANATAAPCEAQLLQAGFLAWADRTPEAAAVVSASRTLSYGQLLAESAALAKRLQASGVQQGELVAVLMHKGWEQVVAVLGTLLAGAAYLPIDAGLPRARQRQLLEIGHAKQVLIQPGSLPANERGAFLDCYLLHEVISLSDGVAAELPAQHRQPGDLAYVIFTSGTTGVPKGVMITHGAAWNTVTHVNHLMRVGPADRVLAVSSLSFDLSVYDIFGLLGAGGALVILEHGLHLDAVAWKRAVAEQGVTIWNSAPQLMRMLMDTFGAEEVSTAPLRGVLLSGDWIPLELPGSLANHYPTARLTALGGATEASIWSNHYLVEGVDPAWTSIPYGKPLPNQTMWVLDQQMRPCPDYVLGRIFIGGAGLARGYWCEAEQTAARFIAHPLSGERLYDTGDLGRYAPDGNIVFMGRSDNQVKIRGHRVEPGEVAAVLRHHADVAEAVVLATDACGERRELVAYVELRSTALVLGSVLVPSEKALAFASQPLREWLAAGPQDSFARVLTPSFKRTWQLLEQLYVVAIRNMFAEFGVRSEAGERIHIDQFMARGVASRYRRWLQRALDTLVQDGYAREWGSGAIELICPLPANTLAEATHVLSERLRIDLDFTAEECHWLFDIAQRVSEVLTEQLHSAELYTSMHTVQFYHKLFPDSHAELARVLARIIASQSGSLDVIEIGAGLGTACQHVLPILIAHGCRYSFTDISDFFLHRAKQMFADDPSFRDAAIDYGLLNVDSPPQFQGYAPHGYDLALAFSMLHNARDIKLALSNILTLLKPGGHLVMLEETRFFRSFDLQLGLQQGFDGFEDEHLRTRHCLLSTDQWQSVLREVGFADVVVLDTPGTVASYLGFHVIVARAPVNVVQLHGDATRAYLSSQLPEYMVPQYLVQMSPMPISVNGKIDYKALPPIPDQATQTSHRKVAPRTATEQTLFNIWQRVMPGREIGVTDNFFDIGGDSLIATQLIREISQVLSFNLEVNDFFENMSIEALAGFYDRATEMRN